MMFREKVPGCWSDHTTLLSCYQSYLVEWCSVESHRRTCRIDEKRSTSCPQTPETNLLECLDGRPRMNVDERPSKCWSDHTSITQLPIVFCYLVSGRVSSSNMLERRGEVKYIDGR
jgi:hypothetical protein